MDRLSGDWNHGYARAIQDIIKIFDSVTPELRRHKRTFSGKLARHLLDVILTERANIRDHIGGGFIRYNGQKDDFEYYIPEKKK